MIVLYGPVKANLCPLSTVTTWVLRRTPLVYFSSRMYPGKVCFKFSIPSGNTSIRFGSQVVYSDWQKGMSEDESSGDSRNRELKRKKRIGLGSEQSGARICGDSSQLESALVSDFTRQRDEYKDKHKPAHVDKFHNGQMYRMYARTPLGYFSSGVDPGNVSFKHSIPIGNTSTRFGSVVFKDCQKGMYEEEFSGDSKIRKLKRKTRVDLGSEQRGQSVSVDSSLLESSLVSDCTRQQHEYKDKPKPAHVGKSQNGQSYGTYAKSDKELDSSEGSFSVKPFDICLSRSRYRGVRKVLLDKDDKENLKEKEQIVRGFGKSVLRPGMVLLKNYLTLDEQIEIVKICRDLGKGPGGFYQPGYKDGAKLRLQMMCLGLDWDLQTRKYEERRHFDGCKPRSIPLAFCRFVERAIWDAHVQIKNDLRASNVEEILPSMSPNICIVNFYKTSGRLGLHQDRDESPDSLRKGLPVVSFSVGDSAEFLYGYARDVKKAEKVVLESGDVLIFGGESRHIFHGVSSIIPESAPMTLLQRTRLSPGRLNLTFRQF